MKLNNKEIGSFPDVELRIIFENKLKTETFMDIKKAMDAWAFLCINRAFGEGVVHHYSDAVLDDDYDGENVILMQLDWGSCEEEYLQYLLNAIDEICKENNEVGYYCELAY